MVSTPQQIKDLLGTPPTEIKPGQWLELFTFFGNLAPLWFCEQAVRLMEAEANWHFSSPQLPQDRGSCWIVMALHAPDKYPVLRPAFVLPLQWQRREDKDPRLPPKLQALADTVRTELAINFKQAEYRQWNLFLHPNFAPSADQPDFSAWDDQLSFESGWVALAGGLYLAQNDGQPDEHVWVSARWDSKNGIRRVGHLPEKLALARKFGVRRFYIPNEQDNEVPSEYQDIVCKLRQASSNLPDVLSEYLSSLDVRPACSPQDEESFQRCVSWYMRQLRPSEHFEYYCECLLPYLSCKLRNQWQTNYPACQPQVLVTVLSQSWNLALLVPRVFAVTKCVFLYTPHDRIIATSVDTVRNLLRRFTDISDARWLPFHDETMVATFRQLEVWQECPPEKLLVDITPGKKPMSLHLFSAAPMGSWILYVDSKQTNGRPVPGSEKLVCWRRE
ncbi:hypothetical protein HRbin36_01891 [bacterium HR36]|nr:hypothetical protein HRbin36_01891 [bacterium HR36]